MRLIFVTLVIVLAAIAGMILHSHHGAVSLQFDQMLVEMPLWFAVVAVIVVLLLWWFCKSILVGFWNYPSRWMREQAKKRARKQKKALKLGLKDFIAGRFAEAEHHFLQTKGEVLEGESYLLAAQSAHEQGMMQQCEAHLQSALKQGVAKVDVDLMRARHLLQQGEVTNALSLVHEIASHKSHYSQSLYLYLECYRLLGDWQSLIDLVPKLRSHTQLSVNDQELVLVEAYQGQLLALCKSEANEASHMRQSELDSARALWNRMPRALRKRPNLLASYADCLNHYHCGVEAEKLVRKQLALTQDETLLYCYSRLDKVDKSKQLLEVEKLAQGFGDSAVLYHVKARIAAQAKQYEQAKLYYKKALNLDKNQAIELEYAGLLAKLGDQQQALSYFQNQLDSITAP